MRNYVSAMEREAMEESGYSGHFVPIGLMHKEDSDDPYKCHVFLSVVGSGETPPHNTGEEDIVVVSVDRILTLRDRFVPGFAGIVARALEHADAMRTGSGEFRFVLTGPFYKERMDQKMVYIDPDSVDFSVEPKFCTDDFLKRKFAVFVGDLRFPGGLLFHPHEAQILAGLLVDSYLKEYAAIPVPMPDNRPAKPIPLNHLQHMLDAASARLYEVCHNEDETMSVLGDETEELLAPFRDRLAADIEGILVSGPGEGMIAGGVPFVVRDYIHVEWHFSGDWIANPENSFSRELSLLPGLPVGALLRKEIDHSLFYEVMAEAAHCAAENGNFLESPIRALVEDIVLDLGTKVNVGGVFLASVDSVFRRLDDSGERVSGLPLASKSGIPSVAAKMMFENACDALRGYAERLRAVNAPSVHQ